MTSSVGLSAVFANVVTLLVMAVAIARSRLSQVARLVIATFALVCAWLVTSALDAMRAPDWTMFMGGAVVVVSIVVFIATLHRWMQAAVTGEAQDHRGDEGGGEPRRRCPDAPQPGGDGSEPSWWPGFERRLALYVAERELRTESIRSR